MMDVGDASEMKTIFVLAYDGMYEDLHRTAVLVAGFFVAVALVLSIFLIFQHLQWYTKPEEQMWIVAVVFMVPVYATESIISLANSRLSLVCDILRNCYEAFALYSFGSYLVACLGGETRVVELLENESSKRLKEPLLEGEDEKRKLQQSSLRKFITRPSTLGRDLLSIEKFGLVQYMILKTVCAFLALILELCGVYGDGEFKWYYGYPYILVVLNFSQTWALFCLVQFYNVTHERLQPIKPLAKFISFKAIVFATWWQGVGIAVLCALNVLPNEGKFQTALQDFLICIEMAIAAIAHIFVFSAKPYRFLSAPASGMVTSETTKSMMKVNDGNGEKPAVVEETDTRIEAAETSIKESVQDIVVEGGQHVVKDVVLTINQAIHPVEKGVEKGVTKIQETFHHLSVGSPDEEDKLEVKVKNEEDKLEVKVKDREDKLEVKVEEHVESNVTQSRSSVKFNEGKDST